MKTITITAKIDVLRVARGHRTLPRANRFGCGKHPSRAAGKRAWRREQ